jgi:hypothetical protein
MTEKITGGVPYENIDTEIETSEDLAEAKELAGVRSQADALFQTIKHAQAIGDNLLFENALAELEKIVHKNERKAEKSEKSTILSEPEGLGKSDQEAIKGIVDRVDMASDEMFDDGSWVSKRTRVLMRDKNMSFDEARERAERESKKNKKYVGDNLAIEQGGVVINKKQAGDIDRQ